MAGRLGAGRVSGSRGRQAGPARLWARRLAALGIVLVALAVLYMAWFRNSSLVSVNDVEVEGVTANSGQVTRALASAADGMTTLHVTQDELDAAVAPFPTIAAVSADPSFPHKLKITVTERLPVAVAQVGGREVAVAADGFVLEGVDFDPGKLPTLEAGRVDGTRLDDDGVAQAVIIGAAPAGLRERMESASYDTELGVVLTVDGAPELRFGDGSRAEAKWEAAAAVLADSGLSGSYVDVSVPERSVSG
ncbi:MAG: FtsQ-type POTRA domain-containing protein [Solirubrobacterales bacterium]|nr:FtsQ-type POTRA domain-containing protein [Solirubrobacterales bacterium]